MNISRTTFWICILCICCAVGLTAYIFLASRADAGLRYAALLGASNIATALVATASTLLTGKDLTKHEPDPADLPPGSVQTNAASTTTAIPPIAPQA
jgi:hypothetical protein